MTLTEFKELNKSIGNHWFSKNTMRFFKSKVEYWHTSGLFITSEQFGDDDRKYTLREASFSLGTVKTVGNLQAYSTLAAAKDALKDKVRVLK